MLFSKLEYLKEYIVFSICFQNIMFSKLDYLKEYIVFSKGS